MRHHNLHVSSIQTRRKPSYKSISLHGLAEIIPAQVRRISPCRIDDKIPPLRLAFQSPLAAHRPLQGQPSLSDHLTNKDRASQMDEHTRLPVDYTGGGHPVQSEFVGRFLEAPSAVRYKLIQTVMFGGSGVE